MLKSVSLFLVLFATWVLLSGFFDTLHLGFGIASCLATVAIAHRMDVIDHEGQPLHARWGKLLTYYPWLIKEIVLANFDVLKRVWGLAPIDPALDQIHSRQTTDLGRVIYAQSITLTPGTVSVDVHAGTLMVHALHRNGIADLNGGEMDAKVHAAEGES